MRTVLRAILLAGLAAGTCDLVFAICYYGSWGAKTQRVLQSVAGGLLGKGTYQGGIGTAALGLVLHYVIALIWASIYVIVLPRRAFSWASIVALGSAYGLFIYAVMNLVVLPLSALHAKIGTHLLSFWPALIHVVGVGLPIALITQSILRQTREPVAA